MPPYAWWGWEKNAKGAKGAKDAERTGYKAMLFFYGLLLRSSL